MTPEQLKEALAETLKPFGDRLESLEQKFSANQPEKDPELTTEPPTSEQFSKADLTAAFAEAFKPYGEKLEGLETKFNQLLQEAPNQRPTGEGAGTTTYTGGI